MPQPPHAGTTTDAPSDLHPSIRAIMDVCASNEFIPSTSWSTYMEHQWSTMKDLPKASDGSARIQALIAQRQAMADAIVGHNDPRQDLWQGFVLSHAVLDGSLVMRYAAQQRSVPDDVKHALRIGHRQCLTTMAASPTSQRHMVMPGYAAYRHILESAGILDATFSRYESNIIGMTDRLLSTSADDHEVNNAIRKIWSVNILGHYDDYEMRQKKSLFPRPPLMTMDDRYLCACGEYISSQSSYYQTDYGFSESPESGVFALACQRMMRAMASQGRNPINREHLWQVSLHLLHRYTFPEQEVDARESQEDLRKALISDGFLRITQDIQAGERARDHKHPFLDMMPYGNQAIFGDLANRFMTWIHDPDRSPQEAIIGFRYAISCKVGERYGTSNHFTGISSTDGHPRKTLMQRWWLMPPEDRVPQMISDMIIPHRYNPHMAPIAQTVAMHEETTRRVIGHMLSHVGENDALLGWIAALNEGPNPGKP